jgi:putative inorganic carbon (HCO3(-)) transporter
MGQTLRHWVSRSDTWLYLLLGYPVIDYVMRKILPIPVVSSFWDDGLLLVLLLFTFFAVSKGKRTLPSVKHPFAAFVVFGLGLMVTDMMNLDASIEGFRAVYQYMIAFFIGFYLLQSTEQLDKFLKILAWVGFFAGLIGVAQVVLGVETPQSWTQEGEATRTRAFSIVTSPNVLGSYMALVVPVSLGLFLRSTERKGRVLWAIVSLTTLAALLFTASRGAWFAFAFAVFVCCYLWNKRVAGILFVAGAAGAVALAFMPNLPVIGSIKDRITTLFTMEYLLSSLQGGRLGRWIDAYHVMRLEPLFGAGLGHHGGAVASRHFGTIYSDSYFFKSLAELGIIGVSLLIVIIWMSLRYGAKVVRSLAKTRYFFLVLGLFGGLLAVSLHNLVENIFEVPFMSIYFWLFAGILCGLYVDQQSQPERRASHER